MREIFYLYSVLEAFPAVLTIAIAVLPNDSIYIFARPITNPALKNVLFNIYRKLSFVVFATWTMKKSLRALVI